MEIKGTVHCFFEQSGTFKNEFVKLGIPAMDYDIQDNFGQTDHVIDLFAEIEKSAQGGASVFDSIKTEDLIMAFFPCIYFETVQQLFFALASRNFDKYPIQEKITYAIERLEQRTRFHRLLYQLLLVCYNKNIRLIIENPATVPNYLITGQNFPPPTFIDRHRRMRGDWFDKPTAYWFINCEPTNRETYQPSKEKRKILSLPPGAKAGICSEERSLMSPDYARNFICDFILGKEQENIISQSNLFDI